MIKMFYMNFVKTIQMCNTTLLNWFWLPGEGSGLDSPPAGLLFWGYEGILGRAPRSGLAKTDTEVEFVSLEGFVEDKSTLRASDSNGNINWNFNIQKCTRQHFAGSNIMQYSPDCGHGLWAIVQFSPWSGDSSTGFSWTGGRTSVTRNVYLQRRSGFTVLQYQREHLKSRRHKNSVSLEMLSLIHPLREEQTPQEISRSYLLITHRE